MVRYIAYIHTNTLYTHTHVHIYETSTQLKLSLGMIHEKLDIASDLWRELSEFVQSEKKKKKNVVCVLSDYELWGCIINIKINK